MEEPVNYRTFLVETYKSHMGVIRANQALRFEILRYALIGYFAYWVFMFSADTAGFLCYFTFETVVLIPGFLLLQVFFYIGIINHKIRKHGEFISYLFDHGLTSEGLGIDHYGRFVELNKNRQSRIMRLFESTGIHYSQLVLAVLAGGSILLYLYVEHSGGFGLLVACPGQQ